jgi:hypothetical protein
MMWLTWRQHRGYALCALLAFAALAGLLIPTGHYLHDLFDQSVAGCLGQSGSRCDEVITDFNATYQKLYDPLIYLNLIPGLVGVFVGAPLLAREVERGTHRTVWTQGITRTRWLVSKLAILLVATAVFAVPFTLLLTWWIQPVVAMIGPMQAGTFDFLDLMPAAHAVFAFALGVACGSLIARTVPAMAATLFAYLAVFVCVHGWLREYYLAPLVRMREFGTPPGQRGSDWILDNSTLVDPRGVVLSQTQVQQVCSSNDTGVFDACLHSNGIVLQQTYQPASRFWTFQWIEFSIFLTLTVALLALTIWWVRARVR